MTEAVRVSVSVYDRQCVAFVKTHASGNNKRLHNQAAKKRNRLEGLLLLCTEKEITDFAATSSSSSCSCPSGKSNMLSIRFTWLRYCPRAASAICTLSSLYYHGYCILMSPNVRGAQNQITIESSPDPSSPIDDVIIIYENGEEEALWLCQTISTCVKLNGPVSIA